MAKNHLMLNPDTFSMFQAPAALVSGQGVLVGTTFGVAETDAKQGDPVAISVRGVYVLPKDTTKAVGLGASLYWDAANARLTTTAGGNTYAGKAWSAQVAADATVAVALNFGSA